MANALASRPGGHGTCSGASAQLHSSSEIDLEDQAYRYLNEFRGRHVKGTEKETLTYQRLLGVRT